MKSQRSGARWTQFGAWVRENRRRVQKTQKEIAQEVGITDVQVSRIENGESGTRWETIPALAIALDVDPEECFRRAGFHSQEEVVPIDEALARIAKSVPESKRPGFLRAVSVLAETLNAT